MSDPKPIVLRTSVSSEDVDTLNGQIADLLDMLEVPRSLAILSLVSMAIQIMNPSITADQLHACTLSTTQYICALVTTDVAVTADGEVDKSKLN